MQGAGWQHMKGSSPFPASFLIISMTDINYPAVVAIILGAIALMVWMARTNLKDEKKFEKNDLKYHVPPKLHHKHQRKI
jgi:hypothetical protein